MTATLLDRHLGPESLLVELDGQHLPTSRLGAVSIRHGRTGPDGQPEPATATITTDLDGVLPVIGQELTVDLGDDALEAFTGATPAAFRSYFDDPAELANTPGTGATRWETTGGPANPQIAWVPNPPGRPGYGLQLTIPPGAALTSFPGAVRMVPAGPGESWTYSGWVYRHPGTTGANQWMLRMDARTSAGVYLGQAVPTAYIPDVPGWHYLTRTWVTPATTGRVTVTLVCDTGNYSVGDTLTITNVVLRRTLSAPAAAALRRFVGTVTDAQLVPPQADGGKPKLSVVAVGRRATLGRQLVGDVPWPVELDGARVSRLLGLASGITTATVDAGTVQVRARDVDRQPVGQLLNQVATDAEGLLVELRDGRLAYQDADQRVATTPALTLAADEVLWPLAWSQDLGGVVNDLTVGYGSAEPQLEVRVTDPASIATHGLYAAKVSTQLETLAAANAYAELTVARRATPWWRVDTLRLELVRVLSQAQAQLALGLEVSALVALDDPPGPSPVSASGRLWVEGWTETVTPSGWLLALAVTPWGRTGPGVRWMDVPPAITWADVPPGLSWRSASSWDV